VYLTLYATGIWHLAVRSISIIVLVERQGEKASPMRLFRLQQEAGLARRAAPEEKTSGQTGGGSRHRKTQLSMEELSIAGHGLVIRILRYQFALKGLRESCLLKSGNQRFCPLYVIRNTLKSIELN
jgi:hypothetical protein